MGANLSVEDRKETTKIVNDVVNEVIEGHRDIVNMDESSEQKINVTAGGDVTLDGCTLSNDITRDITVLQKLVTELQTQFATELTNKLMSKLRSLIQQTNKDLNIAQINMSITDSDIQTQLFTSIKNIINTQDIVKTNVDSDNNQTITFNAGGDFNCKDSTLSQDQSENIVITQLSEVISSIITSNNVLSDISREYSLTTTQRNTGLNVGFSALIGIICLSRNCNMARFI